MTTLIEKWHAWLQRWRVSPLYFYLIAVGLVVHFVGYFLFRIDLAPLPKLEPTEPFVVYNSPAAGETVEAFFEQSFLFDTAALFLPPPGGHGEWARLSLATAAGETPFAARQPRIDVVGALADEREIFAFVPEVQGAADLLQLRFWRLFATVGQARLEMSGAVEPVQPIVLTELLSNGLERSVVVENLPDFVGSDNRLLDGPAEFVFVMDERGLVGRPVKVADPGGTGAFLNAVSRWLRSGELAGSLSPGVYRLRVFP